MDQVTRLNLSSNFITTLQPGVFNKLTSLKVLNLSRNLISEVNNQWLKGLVNLQVLDMSSNNISSLEGDPFACLPVPQTVSLGENQLYAVSGSLRFLDLSFNKISLLNHSPFSVLQSLVQLNLAGNNLQALKGQCFNGLINLQQLDVSANYISSIDDGVFSELNNVQRLNLSRNQLETLGDQCFRGLTHLQQLDVSCNRIFSLSAGTFQSTGGLVELILADNSVLGRLRQELMVLVGTGRRLRSVDVSRSGLTQVPAALTRSIRTLKLQGNTVTTVRCGDLDSYPLLQFLNLADNQIQELEEDALGRLEALSTLDLSGNRLNSVPRSLPAGLAILHLQHNCIQELNSGDLQGLPRLKYLSLRHNGISAIQNGVFSQLTALETLDISENPLKSLPGNALSGPLMTVLRLSHLGGITSLASPSAEMSFPVTSPERLKVLELDSSPVLAQQLLADTAALAAFRQLRELNLIDTGLTNIRSDLFHFLPRLRILRLNGNQWQCEDMLWLANWVRQQQKHQQQQLETSLQDAYCASPPHLASTRVIHLHDADFNNSTEPSEATNTYEATVDARYDAPLTTKMFSILRIRNTQFPDNKTLLTFARPLDNQTAYRSLTKHTAVSVQSSNVTSTSTTAINRVEIPPVNTSSTASAIKSESSSSANNAFTIYSTSTQSNPFIFNTTAIYEDDPITNTHFTDSSVTNNMPDYEDNFEFAHYSDITTYGTFPIDQVQNKNAVSFTKSHTNGGSNIEHDQITVATAPSLKTHIETTNDSLHDKNKLSSTKKNSFQRNKKLLYHTENATSTQNRSISSKTVIKVGKTNTKNTETLKIYANTPSNATRAQFTNKSWTQHKFLPNARNKMFLSTNQTHQSMHNNFSFYKTISNSVKYYAVLKQTFSNKDKFQQYQDKSFSNTMEGGESLNKESEDTTTDNNSPTETGLLNKALVKHTLNITDFINQSTDKGAHKMEIGYYAVMKHQYTNMSTSHSDPNSKTQLQSSSHISVQHSVHRNCSTKIPVGFHRNKLKLMDTNNSENLKEVASKHSNATSSGMNDSENNETQAKSDNATDQSTNITSTLQGVNFVFGNVTLDMEDKSVFYSSHTSDEAFAPGVHITEKKHTQTSLNLGSHPSMFVLLGIGLAMAGAFAMAVSHCANRRRCQAVEYRQQQDIEVRSMTSVGDLW
jgi:Leucine-rich repeat (LRR) protein